MSRIDRQVRRGNTVAPIQTELQRKGYTKDAVIVKCAQCGKEEVCKYTRNPTPGIHYGRPMIQLPEDWKVMYTYGDTKQDVLCESCHPYELQERQRLGTLIIPRR